MNDRPPVAPPPAGFRGTPPLEPGRVDQLPTAASHLGDDLRKVQPAPDATAADNAVNATSPFPTSPPTPKTQKVVSLDSLPPEEQAKAREILQGHQELLEKMAAPAAPPQPEPEAPEEAASESQLHLCPQCGHDQSKTDVVEPQLEDKQMWLRHILGGERFTRAYPLFGGSLIIRLRSRSVAEEDLITEQLKLDRQFRETDFVETASNYQKYALTTSMAGVFVKGRGWQEYPFVSLLKPAILSPDPEPKDNEVGRLTRTMFEQQSAPVYAAMRACIIVFDALCWRLQAMARDEAFFEGLPGEG